MIDFVKAIELQKRMLPKTGFIEEKVDGIRIFIKPGGAWTRNNICNIWDQLPEYLKDLVCRFGSAVDGEMCLLGKHAVDVRAVLMARKSDEKYGDKNLLRFVAFHLPWRIGSPLFHLDTLSNKGFLIPRLLSREVIKIDESSFDAFHSKQLFVDLQTPTTQIFNDGIILKINSFAPEWYKLKYEQTIDLVLNSYKPGEGKYKEKVGAYGCWGYKNGKLSFVCWASGMIDAQREMSFYNSTKGKAIEVKFSGLTNLGNPRHPRFLRVREDKNPLECIWSSSNASNT